MYYGLCFTNLCSTSTLNEYGRNKSINSVFLINSLLQDTSYSINSINFIDVDMQAHTTAGSITVSILICLFIIARMSSSFLKWGKLCVSDSEEEAIQI